MKTVPTYALYGETQEPLQRQWLHCEAIADRSSRFNWEIDLHRHRSFYQILHMTRGGGKVQIGETSHALRPPLAVLVPPGEIHGFGFSDDVEGHVITLLSDRLHHLLAASTELKPRLARSHIVGLTGADAKTIADNIAGVAREFGASVAGRERLIEAHLTVALITLGRRIAQDAGERGISGSGHAYAAKFRSAVDAEYRTARSVSHYAEQLGISETHLNRIARAAFGASALGVINQRLILEASRDLIFTMIPVKEIAYSLGFEDPAYFTRFFTKHCGSTPTEFRKRRNHDPKKKITGA